MLSAAFYEQDLFCIPREREKDVPGLYGLTVADILLHVHPEMGKERRCLQKTGSDTILLGPDHSAAGDLRNDRVRSDITEWCVLFYKF